MFVLKVALLVCLEAIVFGDNAATGEIDLNAVVKSEKAAGHYGGYDSDEESYEYPYGYGIDDYSDSDEDDYDSGHGGRRRGGRRGGRKSSSSSSSSSSRRSSRSSSSSSSSNSNSNSNSNSSSNSSESEEHNKPPHCPPHHHEKRCASPNKFFQIVKASTDPTPNETIAFEYDLNGATITTIGRQPRGTTVVVKCVETSKNGFYQGSLMLVSPKNSTVKPTDTDLPIIVDYIDGPDRFTITCDPNSQWQATVLLSNQTSQVVIGILHASNSVQCLFKV